MTNNILITGGSRGIGKAIVELLSDEGYHCIAPDRTLLDISSPQSINQYFETNELEFDSLINCAGINILSDLPNINVDKTLTMLQTNLIGPLELIRHVTPGMKNQGYGKIINISSIWGLRSKEYRTLYSATKFGLNGITKSLARELGPHNILVNAIAPGYVKTAMTDQNLSIKEQHQIAKEIPLRRFAKPEEIAKLVLFLISEQNTYITGETITIDGGFTA